MARAPQQNPQLDPGLSPVAGETYIGSEGTTHLVGDGLDVAGDFTASGDAVVDGTFHVVGDVTASGNVLVDGSLHVVGNINASGGITLSGVSLVGVTDGDKGDVVVSGSGTTWTVDSASVSNSKMANMATQTFKGRNTAGTGSPEDLSIATAQTMLGLVAPDSGWTAPSLLNSWVNYDTSFAPAVGYRKTSDNLVVIRGLVKNGAIGNAVFNLPSGYRPSGGSLLFSTISNGAVGRVDVQATGDVVAVAGSNVYFAVNIVFYAG